MKLIQIEERTYGTFLCWIDPKSENKLYTKYVFFFQTHQIFNLEKRNNNIESCKKKSAHKNPKIRIFEIN